MSSKRKPARRSFRKSGSRKSGSSAPRKSKETVRVKTFIVEKPVYVSSKGLVERDFEEEERIAAKDYDSKWSNHFRKRMPDFARPLRHEEGDSEDADVDESGEDVSGDYGDEGVEDSGSEEFSGKELPEREVDDAINSPSAIHARSRGLFNNAWWKKAILKGFAVWLAILVLAYIMDFLRMVDVEGMVNWAGFLVFLIIVSIVYERFLKGKVNI